VKPRPLRDCCSRVFKYSSAHFSQIHRLNWTGDVGNDRIATLTHSHAPHPIPLSPFRANIFGTITFSITPGSRIPILHVQVYIPRHACSTAHTFQSQDWYAYPTYASYNPESEHDWNSNQGSYREEAGSSCMNDM
jgi:hypothetical protein